MMLLALMLSLVATSARAWTSVQLKDFQGDLMIWAPEVGCAAEANIKCDARGLKAGWVWSLTIPRYGVDNRRKLYDAIKRRKYTHVAIEVAACEVGRGYHGLYPETAATCATYATRTNTVLRELKDQGLIPICTGLAPGQPLAPGIDKSLCPIAMTDWDNSSEADCRIKAAAEALPDALIYYELPSGDDQPKADACSPKPFPATGGAWLQSVQQKYPKFSGVLYEIDQPSGLEENVSHLTRVNGFWRDTQQVLFETDTYWKFWENLDEQAEIRYNDQLRARAPWLKGFMSGGTAHGAVTETDGTFPFDGELDASQVRVVEAPDFRSWPATTKLEKVRIADHVYPEFSARNAWPDVPFGGEGGSIQFSLGLCGKISGQWTCDAPIELWRGLQGSGGRIQSQNVEGSGVGQVAKNWFYSGRWGALQGWQPKPGEQIGVFVVAGDARNNHNPVKERSSIVLLKLPAEAANATYTAGGSTTTVPPAGKNGGTFVSQTRPPAKMTRGQKAAVSITMKNSGTADWTEAKGYKLGAQSPTDNANWRVGRIPLAAGETVKPGAQHRFSFQVTAPAKAGTYRFQWRMVQEKVEWFGQLSPAVDVVVK